MRYLITTLFMLFLVSSLAKGQETNLHIENVMDKEEIVSTGLFKLKPDEKEAFNRWLDRYVEGIVIYVTRHRLDDNNIIKLESENVFSKIKNLKVGVLCNDTALIEMNEIGLTKQQLQITVEVALRKAGIEVTDQFVKGETSILLVGLEMLSRKDTGAISYFITFHTSEFFVVQRQNNLYSYPGLLLAATNQLGTTLKTNLGQNVKASINAGLDEFINNYLRANPKK